MKRSLGIVVVAALALACGGKNEGGGEEGGDNAGDNADSNDGDETFGEDSSGDGNSSQSTSGDDTSPDSGDDNSDDEAGDGFVMMPDGGAANECDPKAQDCPDGQKCTAWANDGGTFWNANRCVDETGVGVSGDMCMIEGSGVSGIDDCAVGHICMNTNEEGLGFCISFCEGDNEGCPPGNICAIYNDGVLPICLDACDPLLPDCPEGQSCIDTPNQRFICFSDASGTAGADGDPCPPSDGENSCDPGHWCGPGSAGCTDVNCCTPYCDTGDATACGDPEQCVSFFGEGDAPPEYVNVGVCVLP